LPLAPSPVHSFLGPSPMGLPTIFYCLRFETSLFVASYDSRGLRWRYYRNSLLLWALCTDTMKTRVIVDVFTIPVLRKGLHNTFFFFFVKIGTDDRKHSLHYCCVT
jgi:hypothetical protein